MKKMYVILLISVFLINTKDIFADSDTMMEVDNLIKYGLENNSTEISKKSSDLTYNEKQYLMNKNKAETTLPLVLNIFLGLGIGSYVQGDTVGGVIGTVGDILGVGAMYTPIIMITYGTPYNKQNETAIVATFLVGLGVFTFSKIYQIIRPFSYSNMKNAELNRLLFGGEKVTFLFTPFQRTSYLTNKEESGAIATFHYRF